MEGVAQYEPEMGGEMTSTLWLTPQRVRYCGGVVRDSLTFHMWGGGRDENVRGWHLVAKEMHATTSVVVY